MAITIAGYASRLSMLDKLQNVSNSKQPCPTDFLVVTTSRPEEAQFVSPNLRIYMSHTKLHLMKRNNHPVTTLDELYQLNNAFTESAIFTAYNTTFSEPRAMIRNLKGLSEVAATARQ